MSNNLDLTQVEQAQENWEVSVNDKGAELDAAMSAAATIAIGASNEYTLSAEEIRRNLQFRLTDGSPGPSATIDLYCPAISRGLFVVVNDATHTVAVSISGQSETPPEITSGYIATLSSDGTNVRAVGSSGGGTYDIGFFFGGTPTINTLLMRFMAPRGFTFPENLDGSVGYAVTAPDADTAFDIRVNGASVGTMTFANGSNTATFAMASATPVLAGDRVDVVNPSDLNAIADIAFTLAGSR